VYTCDVLIIGAGAAGMMCAIEAGKRARKVIVLDHSEKVGRKILISGGGRCNFTNINTTADSFVSGNRHFCKSALSRYTPDDFLALVKKHGIRYHEKKLGQLFCDDSAQNIVDLLLRECAEAGVTIQLATSVEKIERTNSYKVKTNKGEFSCQSLVIATGGLSIPKIGATGFGYRMAAQFGLKMVDPSPALDGFNLNNHDLQHFQTLSGLSVDVVMSCGPAAFRENLLFTHNGLSGPASLQTSLYWHPAMTVKINLLPDMDPLAWLIQKRNQGSTSHVKNLLAEILPRRFAEQFCAYFSYAGGISSLSDKELQGIAQNLAGCQICPESTVGYRKAEVTRGGVDTNELSSKTMECKKVEGLYFIGEVVDVTGQLGGYNFQWAWASGFAAGQNV
jgi:predicted Rossmann fold flavoprotein